MATWIPIREAKKIPRAQAALDSEWKKSWDMKCWISGSVMEYDEVRKTALSNGKTVHSGRVFPLCVEHSELRLDQRLYKRRLVFECS